eukprot:TRINITY_DN702_c0_g1_i1.p1 TRINITY_DN702_c0_g1~~TRINITY_DN702_c0_g1_i1.p1  ORF type:complete len:322 (+),score=58.54 TRINITY_DN702_c0_g1_i1:75-968(+)
MPTIQVEKCVKNALSIMGKSPLTPAAIEEQIGKGKALAGFRKAVQVTFKEDEDQFTHVANKLRDSLSNSTLTEVPVLTDPGEVNLTRAECRDLLVCGFWNTIPKLSTEAHEIGDMSMVNYGVFHDRDPVAVARISCFLEYFKHVTSDDWATNHEQSTLTFKRDSLKADEEPSWKDSQKKISKVKLHVSSENAIEGFSKATSHVDFANRRLQIHKNIASATQEEVLFSIKQELMLCLPLFSTLRDRDVVAVTNSLQYSSYSGYLETFRCVPLEKLQPSHEPLPTILAMDAIVSYKRFK